jgi:TPR repeat protein
LRPQKPKSVARRLHITAFERADRLWSSGRRRQAFLAFKEAAEAGDPDCFLNLGYFYSEGIGTRRNDAVALKWYRRAYRTSSRASAACNIGCVFRDRGDRATATRWFRRAIALGDVDTGLNLAKMYLQRPGGARRAIPLLKKIRASYDQVSLASFEEAAELLAEIKRRRRLS